MCARTARQKLLVSEALSHKVFPFLTEFPLSITAGCRDKQRRFLGYLRFFRSPWSLFVRWSSILIDALSVANEREILFHGPHATSLSLPCNNVARAAGVPQFAKRPIQNAVHRIHGSFD